MTPEEQRIAIAKAIGWKIIEGDRFKLLHGPHHPSGRGLPCGKDLTEDECFLAYFDSDETASIPDYLQDLNAMHEVCLSLNPSQVNQFVYELAREKCGRCSRRGPKKSWKSLDYTLDSRYSLMRMSGRAGLTSGQR